MTILYKHSSDCNLKKSHKSQEYLILVLTLCKMYHGVFANYQRREDKDKKAKDIKKKKRVRRKWMIVGGCRGIEWRFTGNTRHVRTNTHVYGMRVHIHVSPESIGDVEPCMKLSNEKYFCVKQQITKLKVSYNKIR